MGLDLPELTLLRLLADALTPVTAEPSSIDRLGRQVNPLGKRLFVPPSNQKISFPYPVTLLKTLQMTQAKMKNFLPDEKTNSDSENLSSQNNNPKESTKILATQGTKSGTKISEKSSFQKEDPSLNRMKGSLSQLPQNGTRLPQAPQNGALWGKAAHQVLVEVKGAIEILTASVQTGGTKGDPFREAMKKLKPLLDQLIVEISKGDPASSDEGLPPPAPPLITKSVNERATKKEIPFPHTKRKESQPARIQGEVKREERAFSQSEKEVLGAKEMGQIKKGRAESSLERKSHSEHLAPSIQTSRTETEDPALTHSAESPSMRRVSPEPKPTERTSLPAAPFTPAIVVSPHEKKKKKRKNFWSRKEEDEEQQQ